MPEFGKNINPKNSIMVSRNRPLGFVVGAAGFLGSKLVETLLKKNIQVIGVDDLSYGKVENLKEATKDKDFHFINTSINEDLTLTLPRLDYAFFVAESSDSFKLYKQGLLNFLRFIKEYKASSPKIVLASSIELYGRNLNNLLEDLKAAEVLIAKFVKEHNLNARVVRLSSLYGPKMHFRNEQDPLTRLIQAALLDKLQEEQTSLDFSTRSLFIDDAVDLLLKTVFKGSTSQKIYDGVADIPVKISEIKQILLDPVWHDMKGFSPTELPPWPTPNLKKTESELDWRPKVNLVKGLRETISYFKDNSIEIPELKKESLSEQKRELLLEQSIVPPPANKLAENKESLPKTQIEEKRKTKLNIKAGKLRKNFGLVLGVAIICFGLILPIFNLAYGAISIKQHLQQSKVYLSKGDFSSALNETQAAANSVSEMKAFLASLSILERVSFLNSQINGVNNLLDVTEQGIEAINQGALGMKALYQTTKVISGEDRSDPDNLYKDAQLHLTAADSEIAQVKLALQSDEFKSFPGFIQPELKDFQSKLNLYADLIDKAKDASYLMPQVTAVKDKKVYLVLLQNNLELRPTGGFIGSYARIEFLNGHINKISVDDIYNLDGQLKEHIEPPAEIKNDLGQKDFYLRDSNFEPDFPTAARQAEFFYNKEAGERVNGVLAMDLSASANLINAIGGLDLPDYSENITKDNLFEKVISHAEVNFFPGSQAKRNYLTNLETQLFNKIFFLSDQNWPAIVTALGQSLEQKHFLIYLSDPQVFSYIASQNWSGILPRQAASIPGETNDFLFPVEANLGANKANFYLDRSYKLETEIGKDGEILHHLTINYKNNSPSEVFPGGIYKNRFRIYLPAGTKLTKAMLGTEDITSKVSPFADYNRAGFSMLVEIAPKEQKSLSLNYQLAKALSFKDSQNKYRLDVIKQPGTNQDNFQWNLTFPINLQIKSDNKDNLTSSQELDIATSLISDKSFLVNFQKK
ncbi:DUF4012 domain-containing protein [Candidatus Daviesbacteria bacterium]|nr:DUF4012 domain-containing protein [Candidatus Daviesbacteria bacterium]